jgi:hypothetical protein
MATRVMNAAADDSDAAAIRLLCETEGTASPTAAISGRATGLLDRLKRMGAALQLPIDIEMVASFAGIARVIGIAGLPVAAQIRKDPASIGQLLIECRAEDLPQRRRFSVAHEIGHTLFPDFWRKPTACHGDPISEPGLLARTPNVEDLCDLAGAQLLLPEPLVRQFAKSGPFGMETVVQLAAAADASLVAAGRRLVDLADQPCALAVVSPRLSPTQERLARQLAAQPALPGFARAEAPTPRYRIDYRFSSRGMPYLPRHKSLDPTPFREALLSRGIERSRVEMDLGTRQTRLDVSVLYAPLRDDGKVTERFLVTAVPAPVSEGTRQSFT